MLGLLADDAELEFVDIPVAPFRGRDAIAAAYRTRPPDDELVLLDGNRYAPAGEPHLDQRDGTVVRIRVLYEQFSD